MAVVRIHAGPRGELRPPFELAEDSPAQLDAHMDAGDVLVAIEGDRIIGHLEIAGTSRPRQAEIKNMAVDPAHQRRGVGRALVAEAGYAPGTEIDGVELRDRVWLDCSIDPRPPSSA